MFDGLVNFILIFISSFLNQQFVLNGNNKFMLYHLNFSLFQVEQV